MVNNAKQNVIIKFMISSAALVIQVIAFVISMRSATPAVGWIGSLESGRTQLLIIGVWACSGLGLLLLCWDLFWFRVTTVRWRGALMPDPSRFISVMTTAVCVLSLVALVADVCEPVANVMFGHPR